MFIIAEQWDVLFSNCGVLRDDESVCVESVTYLLSEEGGAGTVQPWEGRVPLNTTRDNSGRDPITTIILLLPPSVAK